MNRRQFLSLLPAAAVAGTATAAAAAAPKSLSLEEGLLSAWRITPVSTFNDGARCKYVTLFKSAGNYDWPMQLIYYADSYPDKQDLKTTEGELKKLMSVFPHDVVSVRTEQGPMRLCPHSLRWFPYSPKTAAI